jgi:hypothetical protein
MLSDDWAFESLLRARRELLRNALAGRREVTASEAYEVLTGRDPGTRSAAQAEYLCGLLAGMGAKMVAQDTWSLGA